MKINVIVHEAEAGGYWAEVPALPGCATEGDTWKELLQNLREAVEGCLSVDLGKIERSVIILLPCSDASCRGWF